MNKRNILNQDKAHLWELSVGGLWSEIRSVATRWAPSSLSIDFPHHPEAHGWASTALDSTVVQLNSSESLPDQSREDETMDKNIVWKEE
jgi:hypothetical protein